MKLMKKIIFVFILLTPVFVKAQSKDISGIWLLKKTKSIRGPNYNNGLPKLMRIDYSSRSIKIETVTAFDSKDTVETQVLNPGPRPMRTISASNRSKAVLIKWIDSSNAWIRNTQLSVKNEYSKPEIMIDEIMKLSTTGDELFFTKNYAGNNDPLGNKDYRMEGVYEKTTEQNLALRTAKGEGIKFVAGMSWDQILAKAKKENKYIFVDCYATWCAPCKKMDKEVYDLNMVGNAFNTSFISVKVQMDTSKKDDNNTKLTYPIARYLEKEFDINVLPTFLFFNPQGIAVHKAVGAFYAPDFITLSHDARNPSVQIYTQLKNAEEFKLTPSDLLELIEQLEHTKQKALAVKVARCYFDQYLYKLDQQALLTKNNLEFLSKYQSAIHSQDHIFQFLLKEHNLIDSIVGYGAGFASGIIESIINKEEVQPLLVKAQQSGHDVDWDRVFSNIIEKYGEELAYRVSVNAKVVWYRKVEKWPQYSENLVLQVEMSGNLNNIYWLNLNGAAWNIFKYSENKQYLQKALTWSKIAIANHIKDSSIQNAPWGGILDTYANLLYKLGRKEEAIKFYQEKILNIGLQKISIYENYVKMFKGDPTWPTSN